MKRSIVLMLSLFMLSLSCGVGFAATNDSSQPPRGDDKEQHHREPQRQSVKKYVKPKVGDRVKTISRSRISFSYKHKPYYFHQGVLYMLINDYYVVSELVKGMVIPDLPENELRMVKVGNKVYVEYYDVLYKPVKTRNGTQYEVVGWIY